MRFTTTIAASALAVSVSAQNYLGFNSGATLPDRSAKFKKDYLAEFSTAQNLNGAPGKFNSVRLYTNIQAYSETAEPIEAFDAAVETKTNILLGVWTSGVQSIDPEIAALKTAIQKHGKALTDLLIGVSIGSEDLYRVSATGIINKSGVGNGPKELVNFISDWRDAFKGTPVGSIPVGHVDTWDVWPNTTNKAVIDAVDFIGVDEYPYYENGKGNSIDNAAALFEKAYQATIGAAAGKPVWVTETGWPASGPDWDQAHPSVTNAKKYWDEVGCQQLFGKTPTFWYNLRDSNPDNKAKFAITNNLSTEPLFDLSCKKQATTTTKSHSASSSTAEAESATESASKSESHKPTGTHSSSEAVATESKSKSESGESASTPAGSKPTPSGESGPKTSAIVVSGSTTLTTITPSNTGSPVAIPPSETGSGSRPGSGTGADSGDAVGTDSTVAPTSTPATTAAAGLSLKGLSMVTYGALALVGGVMAFF